MTKRRAFASWQILVALAVLAVILLVIQRTAASNEIRIATGPPTPEQRAFFESAATRPDLDLFFKGLSPKLRLVMARNLGEHATPGAAKSAAKLLASFDDAARETLTASLTKIAAMNPELVAAEVGQSGSFERLGVFHALRSAGEPGVRAVVAALADPPRRPGAIRFLVEVGLESVPHLIPLLNDEEPGTRAAAAEALGKLRAKEAVGPILQKLQGSEGEENSAYLAALADIGDPLAEPALLDALSKAGGGQKARLLAGLGRMATRSSLERLFEFYRSGSDQDKEDAIAGFVLAGDRALAVVSDKSLRLEVAAKVRSAAADDTIREALKDPMHVRQALKAASGIESLATAVWPLEVSQDRATIPLRMQALTTTKTGRAILEKLKHDPQVGGFAQRAIQLSRTQDELSTMSEN